MLIPNVSFGFGVLLLAILLAILTFVPPAVAQTPSAAQPLITQPVSESDLVALSGNTRAEARNPANDLGLIPDSFPLEHMAVQLRRPAAQEQALEALINQLNDPQSPNYHHWLTAEQLGARFGPAQSDIQAITTWLQRQGFAVNSVSANKIVIDFSGIAGQVRTAFHTEIHNINVRGATRFANMSDPQIPAALAPAIVGVVGLNNIPPRPQYYPARVQYSPGGSSHLVVPADLATIYNLNPVFNGGNTGQGQSIYLFEDTDLYSTTDWSTFRSTFGLSGYPGASLNTIHPGCSDPGINSNGDDEEAILDAEWASAAAPGAAIVMVACSNFVTALNTMFGNTTTYPPSIISISYGECESALGSDNAAYNSEYQTGAAEGWSIYVSAGDGGAAGCDNQDKASAAQDGIAVNGLASTPYDVAVGGTDFSDTYSGTTGTYWNASNGSTFGSAQSYIPEIPWNDSCASQLISNFVGISPTYGSTGLCNSSTASSDKLNNIVAGSGGPSTKYAKPSWQSGFVGIVSDGKRDLPDVSLFAANGVWGHYYVICYSDSANGGKGCSGAPSNWNGAGGTSFASPIWAGFQALINNREGGPQGLPNPRLYALATAEYGAGGSSSCNASNGNAVGVACVFYDVTLGDMDVPCDTGDPNCYNSDSSTYGALSTSTSAYQPAYKTTTGWDFATGIGSVNVTNLVANWSPSQQNFDLTVNVAGAGSGTVTSSPTGINCPGACTASYPSGRLVTLNAAAGAASAFAGWSSGGCSGTGACNLSMTQNFSVTATFTPSQSATTTSLSSSSNPSGFGQTITLTATVTSNGGTPTGTVNFNVDNGTVNVSESLSGGIATFSTSGLSVGSHTISGSYPGNSNFAGSSSPPLTQVVNPTFFTINLSASPAAGGNVCCDGNFPIGSVQTVTASANGGYLFSNWTENGAIVSTSAAYSFTLAGNRNLIANFIPLVTHDFNGDGKSDILWRDTAGDVGLWLMNGAQILQGTAFTAVPLNWSIVGQRDFNGDGKADILWRDTAGDVGLWLMNGTQIVQGGSFSAVPLNWTIVGTGDFNGDGKADILWLDDQNNVGIWFMNGTQILQAAVVGQLPANWIVVGSDMKGEIFLRNTSTGDLGMWVMNGTQIAQNVDLGSLSLNWSVAGIGDFDGNGSSDILLRDTSGNVQMWLMNGTQVLSTTVLGNVPTAWSIAETGDFNGDGKSDILWMDNLGDVGIWFMNGTAIASTTIFGNVGTAWSVQSLNAD